MTPLDRDAFPERVALLEHHLARVAQYLPERLDDFTAGSAAMDLVAFNLVQAVQSAIDVAVALAVEIRPGSPVSYGDAFRTLAEAGVIDTELADRLVRAAGFRNVMIHQYAKADPAAVYDAARNGPESFRAFFRAVRDRII